MFHRLKKMCTQFVDASPLVSSSLSVCLNVSEPMLGPVLVIFWPESLIFFAAWTCVWVLWVIHPPWLAEGLPFQPELLSRLTGNVSPLAVFIQRGFLTRLSVRSCQAASCGGAAPWESQHRCHSPGCDPSYFKVTQHSSRLCDGRM